MKLKPDLDYFASRLNTQVTRYVSYKLDPFVYLIYAFSVYWGVYKCYLFSPFNPIGRTLQKIRADQAEVMLVLPKWLTQSWYKTFKEMLCNRLYIVDPRNTNLLLSQHINEWFTFFMVNNISPVETPTQVALAFLTSLVKKGKLYNQICTPRSALISIITQQNNILFGYLPIVKRYIKGVPKKNPTLHDNDKNDKEPKLYAVRQLTEYLEKHKPFEKLTIYLTCVKPHKAVTQDTVSRCCESLLKDSAINISISSNKHPQRLLNFETVKCSAY